MLSNHPTNKFVLFFFFVPTVFLPHRSITYIFSITLFSQYHLHEVGMSLPVRWLNSHINKQSQPNLTRFPAGERRRSHWYESTGLLLVGCLTSQQYATESQGRICLTCVCTEMEAANQTCYHIQLQFAEDGPTNLYTACHPAGQPLEYQF